MQPSITEYCGNAQLQRLQRSLKFLIKRLTEDDEHSEINSLQHKRVGPNVVTFEKISSKIRGLHYKTTKEFLDDILSIQSTMEDSSSRVKKLVKSMVEYCKMEVLFIEACDSCYELANSNEAKWFSSVCKRVHPLVWAKVIGYPYEPAKLMNIQNEVATVHFFGDYTISQTQTKFCLMFCEKSPNHNHTTKANIMQEVQEYIKNLGPYFTYAQANERLSALTAVPAAVPATTSTLTLALPKEKFTANVTAAMAVPRTSTSAQLDKKLVAKVSVAMMALPQPVVNLTSVQLNEKLTANVTMAAPFPASPSSQPDDKFTANVTATMAQPTASTWTSTFSKSIIDLLNKNEQQIESLKTNFKVKEALYRSEIKVLEEELSVQKRQFEEELLEAKSKKYCDCCKSVTKTSVNIFCGNTCGAKWYAEQASNKK